MSGFRLTPAQLAELTVPGREHENLAAFRELGEGAGICEKLRTDEQQGIAGSPDDLDSRRKVFGDNRFPEPPLESG